MASGQPSVASSKRASGRTPTQTLTPGTRVGRYQVGKVLRLGRAGITYRARDTVRGCDVALKEYLPVDIAARRSDLNVLPRLLQHVDDFVWGRDCFLAEARTLAALATAATPGIVGVDDSLEANGTAYMVTAMPPRETLATWLTREGPVEPDRMTRLLMPLLDGLAQAHTAGLLHLDIKPANIALDDQGFARLFDFGGARAALAARLPSSSAMPATGYTAIEQATFGETGPFTDIYALAATLYESISGIAPPPATKRPTERLAAVPRKAAKAHGPRLLSAIQAGLAVEPAERPASIAAWRSMLDEAIAAASTTAPTLKATPPAVSPPVPPSPSAASLDAALAMTFAVPTAAANTDGSVTSATAPPSQRPPVSTPPGPLDSLLASLATPPTVLTFDSITLTPPLDKPRTPAHPSPSASRSDGNSVPQAPPAAPPSASPPAPTITPTSGNLPMSPASSSVAGMSAETEAPVLDRVTVAPPPATAESLRTDAPPPKTAPSSPAATDAAMAASLRAIADAVTAATVRPIAEVTPKTAPASPITAVHADPQARPRVIALSAKPGAPAPTAERSTGRPWERWKIALAATLAFATIPAGVAGYYVALPPSSAPPPAVVAPASDRLRGVSEAQAAAEANRRAETDARRAQEQADAEAKRSAAAQAEAAARQAAADAEATRQAEAAARQAAAEAEAKRQADAAAQQVADAEARRQATAQQTAEAEAKRQAEAAARQAAEAEATARRLHEEARAADESRRDTEARLAAAADARRQIEADYAKATADQAKAEAEARQEAAAAEAALKMSNRDKRRVQVALTSLGHDTYGADGSFGQRTRKMIAAWQKSRGEFESGYLTPPDLALLWVQAAPALARYERQMALEEQRRQEEEKRQATEAATQPSATVIEPAPQIIEPPAPPLPQASQSLPPTPVAPARPQP